MFTPINTTHIKFGIFYNPMAFRTETDLVVFPEFDFFLTERTWNFKYVIRFPVLNVLSWTFRLRHD